MMMPRQMGKLIPIKGNNVLELDLSTAKDFDRSKVANLANLQQSCIE